MDPSIHVRTMKSYIFSKKQLRRCSGGSEIVDVQNSEAFTNKMNIKDVQWNDTKGYILQNKYWEYRTGQTPTSDDVIPTQKVKVGKTMTCGANFSVPGTWYTATDVFSFKAWQLHVVGQVFMWIAIVVAAFGLFFLFVFLRKKYKWCQPGDWEKFMKKLRKKRKAKEEEKRKQFISDELDKRDKAVSGKEESATVNTRQERII